MKGLFSTVETYLEDKELLRSLGLPNFSVEKGVEHFIGNYKLEHYEKANISIYVEGLPAQFFRFEIETEEGDSYVVKTGSGAIIDYWESALLIAQGMLVCERRLG